MTFRVEENGENVRLCVTSQTATEHYGHEIGRNVQQILPGYKKTLQFITDDIESIKTISVIQRFGQKIMRCHLSVTTEDVNVLMCVNVLSCDINLLTSA